MPAVSSVYRYCISVEHDDDNLIFLCAVESGSLGPSETGKTVELKSGEYCVWGFDNYISLIWVFSSLLCSSSSDSLFSNS